MEQLRVEVRELTGKVDQIEDNIVTLAGRVSEMEKTWQVGFGQILIDLAQIRQDLLMLRTSRNDPGAGTTHGLDNGSA